ncbi:hypothetical protein AGMMS49942_28560 [Spirochaetia bacterium]|nr:hypothetical protein AGMMS49942_28560 [Spirochaetia bacterium]
MGGSLLIITNPTNTFIKKHFCPYCQSKLETRMDTKIVNTHSPEAKEFDRFIDIDFIGDVEVSYYVFHCEACDKEYKLDDIEIYEKRLNDIITLYKANPFYLYFKKHYCPECNAVLTKKYHAEIIDDASGEKQYDILPSRKSGKIQLRFGLFTCKNCGFEIEFDAMKKLEKENGSGSRKERVSGGVGVGEVKQRGTEQGPGTDRERPIYPEPGWRRYY